MIIWGILIIQPAFGNISAPVVVSACSKNKPAESPCSKKKCSKPKPPEDKKECGADRCNPIMSCPTGNFYFPDYSSVSFASLIIPKQKISLVNDNRIQKQLTECWHPPEII
jgi:hypothetical protein